MESDYLKGAQEALRTLVLERLHYYAVEPMDKEILCRPESARIVLQQASTKLVATLVAYVYGEKVQEHECVVAFDYPATWWQHVRASVRYWAANHSPRWCPRRLRWRLQRLDVRTRTIKKTVTFEHYLKYPEFIPVEDREQFAKERFGITGQPLDGARRTRRGYDIGRWWEDD